MNVVIYAPQDREGERLQAMQTYCQAQNYKVVCYFRGRSEFREALTMVCTEADALVVDTFSVISSEIENLVLLAGLQEVGKHLICMSEGIDTSSFKSGKALWVVLEQLSKTAQRVSRKARKISPLHPSAIKTDTLPCPIRKELTLHRVLVDYQRCRKLKASTIEHYNLLLNTHVKDWFTRDITTLTRAECLERHASLTCKSGASTANYVLALVGYLLRFAGEYYETSDGAPVITRNPIDKISAIKGWHKKQANVDNFIRREDLATWFQGVSRLKSVVLRDLYQFLLLTGLRLSEATTLSWDNVDLENGFITIPTTKNNRRHILPLSSQSESILLRRKAAAKETNQFVFPGNKNYTSFNYGGQHKTISIRLGIPFTPHGLRRTNAVTAAALGVERPIIKKLLNHHDGDVTSIYAVYEPETLRPHVQRIADSICSVVISDFRTAPAFLPLREVSFLPLLEVSQ
jgi:integrase